MSHKSRLSKAMSKKPSRLTDAEIREMAAFEAKAGTDLDAMLNRGELPDRQSLEASLLKALTRAPEA